MDSDVLGGIGMKERGAALITVVMAMLVITMISGVFFFLVRSNMKLVNSEQGAILANNLADAGIQYGISLLLVNEIKAGDEPFSLEDLPSLANPPSDPLNNGGDFDIWWENGSEANSFIIFSRGSYGKITRTKTAGFTIGTEGVGGGEGSGGPGGGEPAYPYWDLNHRYIEGDYVVYSVMIDGRSVERLYRARHNGYVGELPGAPWTTWQEITNHYRVSNFYELVNGNTIIYYRSTYWQARWNGHGTGNEPGKNTERSSGMWRELIDEWRPYEAYPEKEVVSYNGKRYRVKWNNPQGPPDASDPNGPWELLEDCVTLQSVVISPSSMIIKEGEKVTFRATALFSDGTTEDVTSKVIWSSTYPQIASISGNVLTGVMDTGVEGCNATLVSASYTYNHQERSDIVINRVGVTEIKVSESHEGDEDSGLIIWEREVLSGP